MEEKILKLMDFNNGHLTISVIRENKIKRNEIAKIVKKGLISKIGRGIYLKSDKFGDEFYILQQRLTKCIFSHNTALYINGITLRVPSKIDITLSMNYNKHSIEKNINVFNVSKNIFKLGEKFITSPQGSIVRVYNIERTICDIIKENSNTDMEIVKFCLKEYVKRKDKNVQLLFEYAKKLKVYDKLKKYLDVII